MKKVRSTLIMASFAMVSGVAFAASHEGAPMGAAPIYSQKKEKMMAACKKSRSKNGRKNEGRVQGHASQEVMWRGLASLRKRALAARFFVLQAWRRWR
jgi:hypothetical protein